MCALESAKVNAIANIPDAVEAARREKHLPKAEIGHRIDRKPPAVSRLFGGSEHNPAWDPLVDLAYAVELELEVKVMKAPKRRAVPEPVKVLRAAYPHWDAVGVEQDVRRGRSVVNARARGLRLRASQEATSLPPAPALPSGLLGPSPGSFAPVCLLGRHAPANQESPILSYDTNSPTP